MYQSAFDNVESLKKQGVGLLGHPVVVVHIVSFPGQTNVLEIKLWY